MIATLIAAAAASTLHWQGTAKVYDGDRTIALGVDSRLGLDGQVDSRSWPLAEGRAKGERGMMIAADGQSGSLLRNGQSTPMPADFLREERAQFGFYLQLQQAVRWCDAEPAKGESTRVFEGPVATSFLCVDRRITNAANWVAAEGTPVRQDFRVAGLHRRDEVVFPRTLVIKRDGKRWFDLNVTSLLVE